MSRMRDLLIKRRSEVTPLIHWDFSGKSNADAGTIVEDLTGNGYDLELKNFAFDNKSGYNGYPTDFRKWTVISEGAYDGGFPISRYENKVIFNGTIADGKNQVGILLNNIKFISDTCIIRITGLNNQTMAFYNYALSDNEKRIQIYNGINIVNTSGLSVFYISYHTTMDDNVSRTLNNVTVEIFPLYPDQLVFNGINNFCQCTKDFVLPISRGYTWIAKYKILDTEVFLVGKGADTTNNVISVLKQSTVLSIYSYGTNTGVSQELFYNNGISYGTSRFAGRQNITKGTVDDNINNKFVLGTLRPTEPYRFFNGTISEFYLFDRDLTQSQIEKFISDNMIPLPEVYYDVEKQGTLNEHTTKDKLIDFSGNEKHGTLHNFTFDESNGWGWIPNRELLNLLNSSANSQYGTATFNGTVYHCTRVGGGTTGAVIIDGNNQSSEVSVNSYKVRVSGISNTGITVSFGYTNLLTDNSDNTVSGSFQSINILDIAIDGEYEIPAYTSAVVEGLEGTPNNYPIRLFWGNTSDTDTECDITVEFLPTDEDCLRFKGAENLGDADTGTYVDSFYNTGFKTIFLLVDNDDAAKPGYFYDQRKNESENNWHFGLYYGSNSYIAYNYRNSGITYINGIINTTIGSGTLQGKRCITIVDDAVDDTNSQSPIIGGQVYHTYTSNMKLYKFLGFKEALSEKQIKMVIEKYGLQVD